MTTQASEAQRNRAEGRYGIVAFIVSVIVIASGLSQYAKADDSAAVKLVPSQPPATATPKVDKKSHEDDSAVSFQGIDDQKRILEAARKALLMHSRNVHDSMSLSFKDIDNKQLLDRDATARLVGIYENMRPRDAAAVFNVMDPHVLVAISAEMNTRKLSAIMAQMSRDRVNMVSQYLVGVRRFHQKSRADEESTPGRIVVSVPQNTPYNAQGKPSAESAPFMPSRQ